MKVLLALVGGLFILCHSLAANASQWESFKTPYGRSSAAIGSYTNGCLAGGVPLPLRGAGYQVIRTARKRYYGHPQLIHFIKNLAVKTKAMGVGDLLIADMSMPRGGDFSSGHTSHQIGLDVDIWLKFSKSTLSAFIRENPTPSRIVNRARFKVNQQTWKAEYALMLQLAAQDKRVARIFVNPIIKQQLCKMKWGNRSWLSKVRPWWGHTYHMHVRLKCPKNNNNCQDQVAPAKGEGCNEINWWKSRISRSEPIKPKAQKKARKTYRNKPAQCKALIKAK